MNNIKSASVLVGTLALLGALTTGCASSRPSAHSLGLDPGASQWVSASESTEFLEGSDVGWTLRPISDHP